LNLNQSEYAKYYLYARIVKAKLFIDNNYFENIDLKNIADEAYFSKFHFIRLFRKIYGDTPHQYLIRVRIERAKEFLAQGFPVSETISKIGFGSPGSFAGLFKRITGQAPSVYQELYSRRQERIKQEPFCFIPNCFAGQKDWLENSNFREAK
jgi:AraC-like DNA-binding protein